jgi:hypothetical protein
MSSATRHRGWMYLPSMALALWLLQSAVPAMAQEPEEGTRIRMQLEPDGPWSEGIAGGIDSEMLTVRSRDGTSEQSVAVSDIVRLQRYTGSKMGKGALIGGIAGAVTGALLGAISCSDDNFVCDPASGAASGALSLGLLGSLIGLAAGAATSSWADVDMGLRAYTDPASGRFGIAMGAPW